MFDYNYRSNLCVGRVTLELTLKPFRKLDPEYIERTVETLFLQWSPLLRYANGCSVLLWCADGSEILEFDGDLDSRFEWCYFVGQANLKKKIKDAPEDILTYGKPYIKDYPDFHYRDLKNIISALKKVGKRICNIEIEVGATFDPGPEFSKSNFKNERHPEMDANYNNKESHDVWYHCAGYLKADHYRYAGYPDGIPEHTPFGRFLGRQFTKLKETVGYDYIWLSNGFGYSLRSWNWTGELFDEKGFHLDEAESITSAIEIFWKEFARECNCRIETRGSNLSTGMDLTAHGSPINRIYQDYNIIAPPNSPWAAIDYRYGLELVGYMSHIAELPKQNPEYMFRYYLHDPWWKNSPWFDRYNRIPCDIYLPVLIGRLKEDGSIQSPSYFSVLSCDDSFGNSPDKAVFEITPDVLDAYDKAPNRICDVTWVYPFSYYCKMSEHVSTIQNIFMDDWFIESAMDNGFPINTVVSDVTMSRLDSKLFNDTVLLMPVPLKDSTLEQLLLKLLDEGQKVLLYGSPSNASTTVQNLIGVTIADGSEGEFMLSSDLVRDQYTNGTAASVFIHPSKVSNGFIDTVATEPAFSAAQAYHPGSGKTYCYATFREKVRNGVLGWVRGSFPHRINYKSQLPQKIPASECFCTASLLRGMLERFGIMVRFVQQVPELNSKIYSVSRRDNARYISIACGNEALKVVLNFPEGAPVCTDSRTHVGKDGAVYYIDQWFFKECLVYVTQQEESEIQARTVVPASQSLDHRILITGLKNADVTFTPPKKPDYTRIVQNQKISWEPQNVETSVNPEGTKILIRNVTGSLSIGWR